MNLQRIFYSILFLSIFSIYSCSDNEIDLEPTESIEQSSEKDDGNGVVVPQDAVSFNDAYSDFTTSLGNVRNDIFRAGPVSFDNPFIKEALGGIDVDPVELRRHMDATFAEFKDLEIDQTYTLLQKKGIIDYRQFAYLTQFNDLFKYHVESNSPKEVLAALISTKFSNEVLYAGFDSNEVVLLQYFGIIYMQTTLEYYDESNAGLKADCDKFWPRQGCKLAAAAAVLAIGTVVVLADVVDQLDRICNLLSRWIPLPSGSSIECELALAFGIYDLVYRWCCGEFNGCDIDPDPCCGKYCPPGRICDDGTCVTDPSHCFNTGCPPGQICVGESCIVNPFGGDACNTRLDCPSPFDMLCVGGFCVPI